MKRTAIALFAASFCALAHAATAQGAPQTVHGDFDGDGRQDAASITQTKARVTLSVRMHGASKPQQLTFGIGGNAEDALCSGPATLEKSPAACSDEESGETLPGCEERPGKSDLTLGGGDCDPIYLYWDKDKKQMAWWRY